MRILVVGTADTKGEEIAYLAAVVREAGAEAVITDVGIGTPTITVTVSNRAIAAHFPTALDLIGSHDRGPAVAAMGEAFARYCAVLDGIDGAIGIGGGGGTSIISAGFRMVPIGFPKLIVSTMASGDVGPYVGVSDIGMLYSVTDFAGLNRLSAKILRNAGFGIVGMARAGHVTEEGRPAIGLTMFGVTTPCVTAVVDHLKDRRDCLVFHATGSGGRAMEKLVDSGMLSGLLDVTTTEIADELFGGVLSAGPDRLGALARVAIPYVGSVGACDMVNFGTPETVPARYKGRLFYHHNPQVTLMRTTVEESAAIGRFIGEKLNAARGPVYVLLPEGGVSALDAPGQAFHDPDADRALFDALEQTLRATPNRRIERLPHHINAKPFSDALAAAFLALAG